jgi:hypothetical protein
MKEKPCLLSKISGKAILEPTVYGIFNFPIRTRELVSLADNDTPSRNVVVTVCMTKRLRKQFRRDPLPVYRSKHPVDQWKVRNGVQEGDIRTAFKEKDDRVKRCFGTKVCP